LAAALLGIAIMLSTSGCAVVEQVISFGLIGSH
jgi:hypothetical protein